ncbi:MAG: hypothetical protein ACYTHM_24385 [Planctomycetota bacterium]
MRFPFRVLTIGLAIWIGMVCAPARGFGEEGTDLAGTLSMLPGTTPVSVRGIGELALGQWGRSQPEETAESSPEAPSGKLTRAVGGGLLLSFALAETDWNAPVGFGFFGYGLQTMDLLPGKSYPFPAVLAIDLEFIYFSAESGISDIHFTAHGTFGVDLLYKMDAFLLYPYVGIGIGVENVSGSKRIGIVEIDADETRLIFPWELGLGFAYPMTPSITLFARFGFSFPINPANIYAFMRLQGGILFTI